VVGAGPYALSTAAFAREQGIDVVVIGRPMEFWRENMPDGMFLRSGSGWHLDAAGLHTLEAYLEERRIDPDDADPIPIALFRDYAEWFRDAKGIVVRQDLVADLAAPDDRFEATLESGHRIVADTVLCAPGIRYYSNLPDWASSLPPDRAAHTCDLVRFEAPRRRAGSLVGGRQSAYEWAALLREHGAERVDIVHRHDVPRFERVSWAFVDQHVERTIDVRGYWRNLPKADQDAIGQRFWEVGRLTLEYWLTPRLDWAGLHRWPGCEVVEAGSAGSGPYVEVRLSNSERLAVDYVVFASGYRADLGRVPYLAACCDGSRWRTAFRSWTRRLGPLSRASTSPASRPPGTSAPSSVS
jgi:FAD-dependent urate hydroxylase